MKSIYLRRPTSIPTLACLTIALLMGTTAATATPIGPSDFGVGASFESFEGLSAGPNITSAGPGYLEPGVLSPYTFASGVTMTSPIPNSGRSTGVIIGDYTLGRANFGLASNGQISHASKVPFGSAYIARDTPDTGLIEFSFDSDMLRVGAYITGSKSVIGLTIMAFDAGGALQASHMIGDVDVSQWGSNFLGLEHLGGIRRVTFIGDYLVLDGLTFEPGRPRTVDLRDGRARAAGAGLHCSSAQRRLATEAIVESLAALFRSRRRYQIRI